MTLFLAILLALLLAENLCVGFYFYFRPDRAIRLAEQEKSEFLKAIALKTINRNYGIQGAPPMDNEFDDPEEPAREMSNRTIEELMPEEAEEKLDLIEKQLEDLGEGRRRSEGSIATRRRMVGEVARLRQHLADNPRRPVVAEADEAPYIGTLEPEAVEHLSALREN